MENRDKSVVILHKRDCIDNLFGKVPTNIMLLGVTVDYYADERFVGIENYVDEISVKRKEEFAHMASLHGWQSSWTMYKENV